MSKTFFPPDGVITDCQSAAFVNRMMELYKRFKEGTVSPEFTLNGLQNLIEGKYEKETRFGVLKLFGSSIQVSDVQTSLGFEPKAFDFAEWGQMLNKDEQKSFLSRFAFKRGTCPVNASLAPYLVNKLTSIERVFEAVSFYNLYPTITLGHIQDIITKFASGLRQNDVLFEGKNGNIFLIKDIYDKSWFLWLWLHSDGEWSYRFMSPKELPHKYFDESCRLWLLPPDYQKLK